MTAQRLEGKRFLVTGGTRGIGRAVVLEAAARGATVVFCGRDPVEGAAVVKQGGAKVSFVAADLSDEAAVERLFDAAVDQLGAIDVLVNNAGIAHDALLVQTSLADWNRVLGVNLRAPFLLCRRAVEDMLSSDGGRIVNVASFASNGLAGQAAYAASKSALLSLTRSIAKEYGKKGIACNAVVPGFIETEMISHFDEEARQARARLSPHARLGQATEVAEAILFLASDDAAFVTGDFLYVAGAVRDVPPLRRSP